MNERTRNPHSVLKTAAVILCIIVLLSASVIAVPKIVRRVQNYQTFMTAKYRAEKIVSERYGADYAIVDTRTQYADPSPLFGNMVETRIGYMEFDFLHKKNTSSGFIIQVSVSENSMKLYRDGMPLEEFL